MPAPEGVDPGSAGLRDIHGAPSLSRTPGAPRIPSSSRPAGAIRAAGPGRDRLATRTAPRPRTFRPPPTSPCPPARTGNRSPSPAPGYPGGSGASRLPSARWRLPGRRKTARPHHGRSGVCASRKCLRRPAPVSLRPDYREAGRVPVDPSADEPREFFPKKSRNSPPRRWDRNCARPCP